MPELYCENLAVTKGFYVEVLGFTIKYERPEEQFVYLTLGGVDIMVECLHGKGRRWITGSLEKPFGRGVNFQWTVADVDAFYSKVNHLAPQAIYLPIETKAYQCGNQLTLQKQFIVQDPDGYLFRFCGDESSE